MAPMQNRGLLPHNNPSSDRYSSYDWRQPYLLQWFRSSRNLDLCLLALCSCVLTLLCHPNPTLLQGNSGVARATSPVPTSSSTASWSAIDLTLKAGLYTTNRQEDEELDPA